MPLSHPPDLMMKNQFQNQARCRCVALASSKPSHSSAYCERLDERHRCEHLSIHTFKTLNVLSLGRLRARLAALPLDSLLEGCRRARLRRERRNTPVRADHVMNGLQSYSLSKLVGYSRGAQERGSCFAELRVVGLPGAELLTNKMRLAFVLLVAESTAKSCNGDVLHEPERRPQAAAGAAGSASHASGQALPDVGSESPWTVDLRGCTSLVINAYDKYDGHRNYVSDHVGDAGAMALAEALKRNRKLTTLNLGRNRIGDVGVTALAEALKSNRKLVYLNLGRNSIGDVGATALAEALKSNSVLKTLHLGRNSIGDVGATAVAEALKSNGALTTLNLEPNAIGDAGATALAEALKSNGALTTLNLWTKIPYEDRRPDRPQPHSIGITGVTAFAEALKSNSVLTHLHLGSMDKDDAIWNAIKAELHTNASPSAAAKLRREAKLAKIKAECKEAIAGE